MSSYYISSFSVKKLWGYRDIELSFHDDITILIGPNASGKTTIINLLQYVISGNLLKLIEFEFKEIVVVLYSSTSNSSRKLKITIVDETLRFQISSHAFVFSLSNLRNSFATDRYSEFRTSAFPRSLRNELQILRNQLEGLVTAVWLPVSRRLPISDEDEQERRSRRYIAMESVDECLNELLVQLQQHRLALDSRLAELRKGFQRSALANILYDQRHDKYGKTESLIAPTEEDKAQLIKAFKELDIFDKQMDIRINEHFDQAVRAVNIFKNKKADVTINTAFILPLINRTKELIDYAHRLETETKDLFSAIHLFETTVNSFYHDKEIVISSKGMLEISSNEHPHQSFLWRHLSSGEKQILILLVEALLWEDQPVVYVADETELSLHIEWQSKLISSIKSLAQKSQLILATHSPDIVGIHHNNVIDLRQI